MSVDKCREAEVVRREWLTSFLSRRTLPKDALPFAARVLVENTGQVRSALDDHHALAMELLGYEYKWGTANPLATLIEHNPAKTSTVVVAVALASLEGDTSKNTWRNPDADDVAYFTALQNWGYTLSEVENIVLGIQPEPADEDSDRVDEAAVPDDASEPDSGAVEPVEQNPEEPEDSEPSEPDDAEGSESVEQDAEGE